MTDRPSLLTSDDTFFGVCQALGDDLGFSPDILRVALALGLFWNPWAVAAAYACMAVLVLLSRLAFPERQVAAEEPALEGANDEAVAPVALAA